MMYYFFKSTLNKEIYKKKKRKNSKNGENVPYLEIPKVIWMHGNVINNDYQHDSRVL